MFGTNRTVLRAGGGMSFDQEYGGWKVGVGWVGPYVGTVRGIQDRGQAPQYMHGSFLDLPSTASARVHSDGAYSYDGSGSQTGQVYSYNLSIQHELFDDTKVEIAYVGNQGRHMRNHRAWNVSQIAGQPIILNTGETIRAEGNRDQRRPYPLIATTLADPLRRVAALQLVAGQDRADAEGRTRHFGRVDLRPGLRHQLRRNLYRGGAQRVRPHVAQHPDQVGPAPQLLHGSHLETAHLSERHWHDPDVAGRLGGHLRHYRGHRLAVRRPRGARRERHRFPAPVDCPTG